ncbi:MAG: hypothetical protein LBH00_11130 [Planctomycetaceae bacterium]|nr:hypothetical protein [Planctomycetaceae bacterium]
MSAISFSSFSSRAGQGATLSSAQRSGTTYGSYNGSRVGSSTTAARTGSSSSTGSAYCPTCGGSISRSASPGSSSYCPTCNRTGGTQSNPAASRSTFSSGSSTAQSSGQGGRICVTCAYQSQR